MKDVLFIFKRTLILLWLILVFSLCGWAEEDQAVPGAKQEKVSEKSLSDLTYVDDLFKNIPHDFDLRISIVEKKTDFAEGETVSFEVFSEQDCHIAVLNHRVDGTIVILFPNVWDNDTFVEEDKLYYIPHRDSEYPILVGTPFGLDVVQVIGCTDANEFHKLILDVTKRSPSGVPFASTSRGTVTRGLQQAMQQLPSSPDGSIRWSEAYVLINTHP